MIGIQTRSWQSNDVLHQISPLLHQLKTGNNSNIANAFLKLFTFYLGSPNEPGILENFASQHSNYNPMEWAGKLQQLIEYVTPDSFVFDRAFKNRDVRISLNKIFTPPGMDLNSFQKQAIFLDIRIVYEGYSVPVLDCFYLLLAQAIYRSESNTPDFPQYEQLMFDELFGSLARNPFLIVLRKHLNFLGPNGKSEMKKISSALKLYLSNQILMKYQLDRSRVDLNKPEGNFRGSASLRDGSIKSIQLKYKMKMHHIHALMLMLHFAPEYFHDFSRVCLAYLEYFPAVGGNSECLQALIRAWIFSASIKKRDNLESQIIKAVQKANSKDGWFVLQRESLESISVFDNIGSVNIQVAQSFLRVIENESNWSPSASMLVGLAYFYKFLKSAKIYYPDFANTRKSIISDMRDNSVQQKALRTTFSQMNSSLIQIHWKIWKTNKQEFNEAIIKISQHQKVIEEYAKQFLNSKSNEINPMASSLNHFKFKEVNEQDLKNMAKDSNIVSLDGYEKRTPESKRHLVSFYRRDPENVWKAPVQYNEWIILHFLFSNIAKLTNLVTRGTTQNPWLNLRWLANPVNFFACVLLILAIHLIYQ